MRILFKFSKSSENWLENIHFSGMDSPEKNFPMICPYQFGPILVLYDILLVHVTQAIRKISQHIWLKTKYQASTTKHFKAKYQSWDFRWIVKMSNSSLTLVYSLDFDHLRSYIFPMDQLDFHQKFWESLRSCQTYFSGNNMPSILFQNLNFPRDFPGKIFSGDLQNYSNLK